MGQALPLVYLDSEEKDGAFKKISDSCYLEVDRLNRTCTRTRRGSGEVGDVV